MITEELTLLERELSNAPESNDFNFVFTWSRKLGKFHCKREYLLMKNFDIDKERYMTFLGELQQHAFCDPYKGASKVPPCLAFFFSFLIATGCLVLGLYLKVLWIRMAFFSAFFVFFGLTVLSLFLLFTKTGRHQQYLKQRRGRLREFLRERNGQLFDPIGQHWSASPRLSYLIYRMNYTGITGWNSVRTMDMTPEQVMYEGEANPQMVSTMQNFGGDLHMTLKSHRESVNLPSGRRGFGPALGVGMGVEGPVVAAPTSNTKRGLNLSGRRSSFKAAGSNGLTTAMNKYGEFMQEEGVVQSSRNLEDASSEGFYGNWLNRESDQFGYVQGGLHSDRASQFNSRRPTGDARRSGYKQGGLVGPGGVNRPSTPQKASRGLGGGFGGDGGLGGLSRRRSVQQINQEGANGAEIFVNSFASRNPNFGKNEMQNGLSEALEGGNAHHGSLSHRSARSNMNYASKNVRKGQNHKNPKIEEESSTGSAADESELRELDTESENPPAKPQRYQNSQKKPKSRKTQNRQKAHNYEDYNSPEDNEDIYGQDNYHYDSLNRPEIKTNKRYKNSNKRKNHRQNRAEDDYRITPKVPSLEVSHKSSGLITSNLEKRNKDFHLLRPPPRLTDLQKESLVVQRTVNDSFEDEEAAYDEDDSQMESEEEEDRDVRDKPSRRRKTVSSARRRNSGALSGRSRRREGNKGGSYREPFKKRSARPKKGQKVLKSHRRYNRQERGVEEEYEMEEPVAYAKNSRNVPRKSLMVTYDSEVQEGSLQQGRKFGSPIQVIQQSPPTKQVRLTPFEAPDSPANAGKENDRTIVNLYGQRRY